MKTPLSLLKSKNKAADLGLAVCSDGWRAGYPAYKLCRLGRKGREDLTSPIKRKLSLSEVEQALKELRIAKEEGPS